MSSSHLFLGLPIDLLVLYFELNSGFHSAALINHLSFCDVAVLNASLHFIFFESTSNILSYRFPSFQKLQWCSFQCVRPIPLLRSPQRQFLHHCQSRMTRHCLDHNEMYRFFCLHSSFVQLKSVSFISSLFLTLYFSIFLYLLFVCIMRRSIFRCADCIILSCSLVGAHVPDAEHIVGVIAASNSRRQCLSM